MDEIWFDAPTFYVHFHTELSIGKRWFADNESSKNDDIYDEMIWKQHQIYTYLGTIYCTANEDIFFKYFSNKYSGKNVFIWVE